MNTQMAEVHKIHTETDEPIQEKLNLENSNLRTLVMTYENEINALKEKILKLQDELKNAGLDTAKQAVID